MSAAAVVLIAVAVQAPAAPSASSVAEAYFLFLQSRQLEQQGDLAGAIAALRKAAALVPNAAEVSAELAGLFAREGRAAESIAAAEAALAVDPDNREAHRIMGFVQSAVADAPASAGSAASLRAQAIRHFERALGGEAPISDPAVQLALGRLYGRTGAHEKAVSTFKAFLSERPGYPEALLLLAESAEQVNQWEDAAGAWGQVVEMGPRGQTYRGRYAAALVKLGDQYFEAKRYRDAADAFDRALAGDRSSLNEAEVIRKRDRARALAGR